MKPKGEPDEASYSWQPTPTAPNADRGTGRKTRQHAPREQRGQHTPGRRRCAPREHPDGHGVAKAGPAPGHGTNSADSRRAEITQRVLFGHHEVNLQVNKRKTTQRSLEPSN